MARMITVLVVSAALALACGGGKASPAEAPARSGAQQPASSKHGGSLSFGKPSDWTKEKETLQDGGKTYVLYTIGGPEGTVQLIIHPPGTAPSPSAELQTFRAGLQAEAGDAITVGEPRTVTRELAGQTVEGLTVPLTIPGPDGALTGEHQSFVVDGTDSSVQVVVDVPDTSAPGAMDKVDAVLGPLKLP